MFGQPVGPTLGSLDYQMHCKLLIPCKTIPTHSRHLLLWLPAIGCRATCNSSDASASWSTQPSTRMRPSPAVSSKGNLCFNSYHAKLLQTVTFSVCGNCRNGRCLIWTRCRWEWPCPSGRPCSTADLRLLQVMLHFISISAVRLHMLSS